MLGWALFCLKFFTKWRTKIANAMLILIFGILIFDRFWYLTDFDIWEILIFYRFWYLADFDIWQILIFGRFWYLIEFDIWQARLRRNWIHTCGLQRWGGRALLPRRPLPQHVHSPDGQDGNAEKENYVEANMNICRNVCRDMNIFRNICRDITVHEFGHSLHWLGFNRFCNDEEIQTTRKNCFFETNENFSGEN